MKAEVHRTICTHCSVGCAIDAVVENGVWTRQEPVFDSPLNMGAHCAKGASIREHGHGEHRLKSPMKLVNGKWQKITWEQAINELGDKLLAIRKESGPDAVFYYRIQSPVILIEFDHQSPVALPGPRVPGRAHVHTVVRTPNGNDYGKDLLRQHYEAHKNDPAHGHRH